MKNTATLLLLTLAVLANVVAVAQTSQNSAASQSVELALSNAIELTFPNGNATQTASINTIGDLLNGVELPDTEVKVRSNKPFKVDVASSSNTFTYVGSALLAPLLNATSAIRVKVSNNETGGTTAGIGWLFLNSLGTTPVTVLNNCDPGDDQTFSVRYKMIPGLTLPAGTYTIDMVLTATQL
jgi:hypothetical protein